jgi:Ca2+-binding RTX toxin-like protein
VNYTLGAGSEVESMTLLGTATALTGNELANTLIGGALADSLSGGAGNDSLVGWAGADTLLGGDGNDTLVGGADADLLVGGLGDDSLIGSGNATLAGGAGNDVYYVSAPLNLEVIENAGEGNDLAYVTDVDVIDINGIDLEGVVVLGTVASEVIGNGLANSLAGNGADNQIDGGVGNDTLSGGGGNDTLWGGVGQDLLFGGAGNDLLDGGAITDLINYTDLNTVSYLGASAAVVVNLATGVALDGEGGIDTLLNLNAVTGSAHGDLLSGSTAAIFEQFEGGLGDDTIDGGAINTLFQNNSNRASYANAGAAVVVDLGTGTASGGAGNDVLININHVRGSAYADVLSGSNDALLTEQFEGRAGNDTINGFGGTDLVRYDAATTGVTVNLVAGTASDGQGGTDTLFNIEGVRGSNFADVLTGGATANGVAAIDGFEFFIGNAGNDTIDGGAGYDRVDYTTSTTGVTVTLNGLGNGSASDGLGGTDTLINIEAVRGSAFADVLNGSDTSGLAGDENFESFEGRDGNDTLNGGGGYDRADYSGAAGSVVASLASGIASDGYGSTDTLLNIEGLRGSSFNDVLTGGAGNDNLNGNGGNDSLFGEAGNDVLLGGAGADTLIGGAGNDTLDGGVILDRINYADLNVLSYAQSALAVSVNLATGSASDGMGEVDTLANLNFVVGSAYNDSFIGSTTADFFEQFEGGLGNDTIDGGAVDAILQYNSNRVSYLSAAAAVTVDLAAGTASGGAGNDVLININHVRGSGYGDTLLGSNTTVLTEQFEGRGGNDTINGLGGNDMVRYDGATGSMTVNLATGTASGGLEGTDTLLNIEGIRGSSYGDLLTGGATANGVGATDGFEFFVGNGGNDTIDGGAGYDRVDYNSSTSGVVVQLSWNGSGTASDGLGGNDTLIDIEAVRGSRFGDVLLGSDTSTASAAENFESFEGREGNDTIDGGGGYDRVDYAATLTGVVVDLGTGTASNDGFGGQDVLLNIEGLRGSTYADALTGSAVANNLAGGLGNDTLTGGLGNDKFVFETALDAASNVDQITDFTAGDLIALDNDVFTALGAAGALGAGLFTSGAGVTGASVAGQTAGIYHDTSTGNLYYDADGFGGVAAVHFAALTTNPALTVASFIVNE